MIYPLISIIIPTLNSQAVLESCLKSIASQDYPPKKIEIIVSDGGSIDQTLQIAKKYSAKVVQNKLKTAEAGKAAGLKAAGGEFIALIDSDNILPVNDWLKKMITPLIKNKKALGSEPLEYTWRASDGFISRYCALLGMNDPLVLFLGNYDRYSLLSGKWTEVKHFEKDMGDYLIVELDKRGVPTIGANGTVFRASFLESFKIQNYLFDIDLICSYIQKYEKAVFIKVKTGIIHTYCERDIVKFALKQKRRVKDYLFHSSKNHRNFNWTLESSNDFKFRLSKFVIYCITLFPLVGQSIKGYLRKPDVAWFFHPIACEITLWQYSVGFLESLFSKSEMSRGNWKQ